MTTLYGLAQASSADAFVSGFIDFATAKGLELYPAQEEALLAIAEDKNVILSTPTGSGKSLVAQAQHVRAMMHNQRSFYTCPIKALVSEKFFQLCADFGAEHVGMMTGDGSVNPGAPIICCTAEVLAQIALQEGDLLAPCAVIADEFHYYADKERGAAWQVPLLVLKQARFLLMSATLGDPSFFENALTELTGVETAVIGGGARPVPLDFSYRETTLQETVSTLLEQDKAPIYLVSFTQRNAAEEAQNLMSLNFCSREEKQKIAEQLIGFRFDTPYGKEVQRFLRHGIGVHHAGLLPKYRLLTERLAQHGLLKLISGTDTLGVGVNIPIRSVLLTQLCKFDGEKSGILTVRDFHQIVGRAGRRGFDDRGYVFAQAPEHVVENLKLEAKAQAGKKVVKRKPPERGYVHWDKNTFERLIAGTPEPLVSQLDLTHGMLLATLQDPRGLPHGYRRLLALIQSSHESDYKKKELKKHAAVLFRTLRGAGIVQSPVQGKPWRIDDDLQGDFSLTHALSIWLLDVLPEANAATDDERALIVLSLVEAICENPTVVLQKQTDKLKTEKMNQMKAEGVPYEERIAALDDITYPKPHADFIYPHFNAFAQKHPWLRAENIRPKSIAREIYETFASFGEYVRDYGLQRSEGMLLRYLTEVTKVLVHTLPKAARTEAVDTMTTHLVTLVKQVDRSLLQAWEKLTAPSETPEEKQTIAPSINNDPALMRTFRSLAHRLLRVISRGDFEEAGEQLSSAPSVDALKEAFAPYFAEHKEIVFDRQPTLLTVNADVDVLRGSIGLCDSEGPTGWQIRLSATREALANANADALTLEAVEGP